MVGTAVFSTGKGAGTPREGVASETMMVESTLLLHVLVLTAWGLLQGLSLTIARVENRPSVRTLMSVERREESSVLAAAFRIELESREICVEGTDSTPVCSNAIDKISPNPPPPALLVVVFSIAQSRRTLCLLLVVPSLEFTTIESYFC